MSSQRACQARQVFNACAAQAGCDLSPRARTKTDSGLDKQIVVAGFVCPKNLHLLRYPSRPYQALPAAAHAQHLSVFPAGHSIEETLVYWNTATL